MNEHRGKKLKEEGNIQNEVPRLRCSGPPFNDTVRNRDGERQHRKNFGDRSHRRMAERDRSGQQVNEMCSENDKEK